MLKAQTTSASQLPSEILTETYVLVPGPITATPPLVDGNYIFDDAVVVRLAVTPDVPIYYTLNDSIPLDGRNRPVAEAFRYSARGIPLKGTYTVTAMALADDSVPSDPFRFLYTKRGGALNTPLVTTSNSAYTFKDSLRINLTSTPGSTIRYTRDGIASHGDQQGVLRPRHHRHHQDLAGRRPAGGLPAQPHPVRHLHPGGGHSHGHRPGAEATSPASA